ncbi:hypothetical protein Pla86_36010 [Planctomycetes bacterium Pla86]|uniref:Uncharacterized protein n=1 Tax=Engelhardtia mirabilis TaxID=2528011 RepID=A0A518BLQ0_9BACT|nr:hypothetical protein Pla133_29880 [Planctomycetes bacterium Pla133]QDU68505.1 hypothetical protein Pla133_36030 [Planctomycetes bacterium Pla133]QDV02225.1 hypothetical protein Pla86_29870 [Planctomycetes bacterium Pla86]QDV02830.1 hypothetical protein Pla86_36010 [Planctomycetes bacterium Pla86]
MNPNSNSVPRSVPAEEALALLKEHSRSDVSLAAFARSKGVKPWSLYNARAAERRRAMRPRPEPFFELRLEEPAPTEGADATLIELVLPSGLSLRVRRDFDEVALRRLLGVLGSC